MIVRHLLLYKVRGRRTPTPAAGFGFNAPSISRLTYFDWFYPTTTVSLSHPSRRLSSGVHALAYQHSSHLHLPPPACAAPLPLPFRRLDLATRPSASILGTRTRVVTLENDRPTRKSRTLFKLEEEYLYPFRSVAARRRRAARLGFLLSLILLGFLGWQASRVFLDFGTLFSHPIKAVTILFLYIP